MISIYHGGCCLPFCGHLPFTEEFIPPPKMEMTFLMGDEAVSSRDCGFFCKFIWTAGKKEKAFPFPHFHRTKKRCQSGVLDHFGANLGEKIITAKRRETLQSSSCVNWSDPLSKSVFFSISVYMQHFSQKQFREVPPLFRVNQWHLTKP